MSAGVETSGGGRGRGSQDFDLNIASIIDCFTVLIAFMLVSASFLSIGILDAGVAAAGATQAAGTPPAVSVTVELSKDQKITVKVSGKANDTKNFPAQAGKWDYTSMTQQLAGLKGKWTDLNAVTLTAEESVEYQDVVKTMEVMRKSLPVVLLGGF